MQSIIVFNGGSAGDFLKALCIEQLHDRTLFSLDAQGMIEFSDHYFKVCCERIYLDEITIDDIDLTKVFDVDNSHFYLDVFTDLAQSLFYIDYPDTAQELVMTEFINKRLDGDSANFYNIFISFIPVQLRKYITEHNLQASMNTIWQKNLKLWRNQKNLQRIDLCDIVQYNKLVPVVQKLCNKDNLNFELLDRSYQQWLDRNQTFRNFFNQT